MKESDKGILQPVTTRDCALALTIPLTKDEFLRDLTRADKDYAKHVRRSNLDPDWIAEDHWHLAYKPTSAIVVPICEAVEKLGVTVVRSASLSDFGTLLKKFKVVTLVAHWCFSDFTPDEIIDLEGFIGRINNPVNVVQSLVRDELAPLLKSRGQSADDGPGYSIGREELAEQLNVIARKAYAFYQTKRDRSEATSETNDTLLDVTALNRLTRIAIEQGFPDELAFGKSLEFSDGLCSVADVIDRIPEDFSGLIDLTSCNSAIIGEIIKFRRPRAMVMINRYSTLPQTRLVLYKLIIRQLAGRPAPFMDAVVKIHKGVLNHYEA